VPERYLILIGSYNSMAFQDPAIMSARLPGSGATKASLMEALQNPMPSNGLNGYRMTNGHDSMDSNHNSGSNDAISGAFYRLSHPEVMMRGLIIE
jgi:hypothetical protein